MSDAVHTLAQEAVDEFLREQRTGVLSLANGDRGYGIPMAFSYEQGREEVYLRLGYGPDSTKREFVIGRVEASEITGVIETGR